MPSHTIQRFLISLPFPWLLTGPDRNAVWTDCSSRCADSAANYHPTRTAALLLCDIIQHHNCTAPRDGGAGGGRERGKTLHGCNSKSWRTPRSFQQDFNPIKANQNNQNSTTESTADNVLVTQLSTFSSPVEDSVCCIKGGRKYRLNPSPKGGLRREWRVMLLIYVNVGFLAGFSAGFRSFPLCKWELKCRTCSMLPAKTITFLKQGFNWRS